jgi:uncharacterized protein YbjT (DUF2867 family)
MNVVVFGATGMVGAGVLRECLIDRSVERVLAIGRSASGQNHPKLQELVLPDMFAIGSEQLSGYDTCFFCLGVSSVGMREADYTRITLDLTLVAADALLKQNPGLLFVYVSGAHTDSSERGRTMWARVKGKTENALLAMPFKAAYMFRPGYIQPVHGVRSKTALYRSLYVLVAPLYPMLKALAPKFVTTTENIGRAMLEVAKHGAAKRVLESVDIEALARTAPS